MRALIIVLALSLGALPGLGASPAGAAALKLTTWDLGWLTLRPAGDPALPPNIGPRAPADLARLAAYAAALAADVVAFQGIDGVEAARLVFPADRWTLHMTGDQVLQRAGFAVRRGLGFKPSPDLAALDPFAHARYRLRSGAEIQLDLAGAGLRLLAVHLKSGCRSAALDTADIPACAMLRRQREVLAAWVAQRQAAGEAFAILGDFGRVMDGDDDFVAGLAAPLTLLRVTEGHASPCWGGGAFVDHILLGGAARQWLQPGSLRVMVYRETNESWRDRLSGHCPVSASLLPPG